MKKIKERRIIQQEWYEDDFKAHAQNVTIRHNWWWNIIIVVIALVMITRGEHTVVWLWVGDGIYAIWFITVLIVEWKISNKYWNVIKGNKEQPLKVDRLPGWFDFCRKRK